MSRGKAKVASSQKQEQVGVPVTLTLSKVAYDAFVKSLGPEVAPEKGIASRAAYFLTQYAGGGLMLTPSNLRRIAEAIGTPVEDAEGIVKALQSAGGKKEGEYFFEVAIDPSFIEPLKQMAADQSWTVSELLSDAASTFLTNGWLYELDPGSAPLFFTPEDRAAMDRYMGSRTYNGRDVLNKLKGKLGPEPPEMPAAEAKPESEPAASIPPAAMSQPAGVEAIV